MVLSIGSVAGFVVRLVTQAGMLYAFYWIVRTMLRRAGGLRAVNPFQPGWGQLREHYASRQNVPRMTMLSARIGGMQYTDVLQIGFDTEDVVIRNNMGLSSLVRIPYSHIEVVQAPAPFQATRVSETEYSPGLFQVGGVEIGLEVYWAKQLLQRLAATSR